MEKIAWLVLGSLAFVAALNSRHDDRWRTVGLVSLGVLFTVFGALVNLVYLLTDTDFGPFADDSWIPFVRDTWRDVVAPKQTFWIGLLIAFEAIVGVLLLLRGRFATVGLVAALGFHVALLVFSWWIWAWCVPMIITLVLLLRAQLRSADQASSGTVVRV